MAFFPVSLLRSGAGFFYGNREQERDHWSLSSGAKAVFARYETMQQKKWILGWAIGLTYLGGLVPALGEVIAVGSGANQAHLVIQFGDNRGYEFDVFFEGTTTGLGLMDIIEAHTSLTTERDNFGFGIFIDGISFEGHSDIGYQGGENWWHYWTKEDGLEPWQSPVIGATDRIVTDGAWDGWSYGRSAPPVPEPASVLLVLAGGMGMAIRRIRI